RSSDLSDVRDVTFRDGTDLCSNQRRDGHGFPRERHEFDLVTRTALVNVDDGADVARLQSFVRNVFRQHDAIVFANHKSASKGCAVMSRGAVCPWSSCQTVRMRLVGLLAKFFRLPDSGEQ